MPAFLESWGHAHALIEGKAQEDSAITGCNVGLATISQVVQTVASYELLAVALETAKKTHDVSKAYIISFLIPLSLGLAKYILDAVEKRTPGLAKTPLYQRVTWLHNNLGSLCQIASVITSLALLQLGCTVYATTSLSILALGLLTRRHYLPLQVEKAISQVSPWIGNVGMLLYGNWLFKLIVLPELIDGVHRLLFQKHQVPYEKASHVSLLANLQQFNAIMSGSAEVEVNRDHIWIAPFPIVSVTDFKPLIAFSKSFRWPIDRLEECLQQDPRWHRSVEKPFYDAAHATSERRALAVQYAQNNFETLVLSVQNENIVTGEVLDYGVLRNYLGYITEKLPLASKALQDQIMIQLAVEGGDYCGPGIYKELETAATALLLNQQAVAGERARLPLKQRILLLLQQERMRVIEAFHMTMSRINPGFHLWKGGRGDIHAMNYTIEIMGSDFGLPDQGARQDKTARAIQIEKWIVPWYIGTHPNDLWTGLYPKDAAQRQRFGNDGIVGYTVDRILNAFKAQAGLPLIPNGDVHEWAQNWIRKESIAEADRDTFLDKLQDGTSFERHLKFKDNFLMAMLVDMGILKIKKRPQTVAVPVQSTLLGRSLSARHARV